MPSPAQTSGTGVAANISVNSVAQNLSLTGTNTFQIVATVTDAAGTVQTGTAFVLTSVANASGGTTTYTGTITGGGSNAFAGFTFTIAGFVTGANNGVFECSASTATTLVLSNAVGVTETHAATATPDDAVAFKYVSRSPAYATVSTSGKVTGVAKGGAVIEVSYPLFGNSRGVAPSGEYIEKVYKEVNITVKA